jgi:hypothetical protein
MKIAPLQFMRFRDKLLRDTRGAGPWPATAAALPGSHETSEVHFGASLDIKFTNALARDPDSG